MGNRSRTDIATDRGHLHWEPVELAYDELRALAARLLAKERRNHSWRATALVHEAVLRLDIEPPHDRVQLLRLFAGTMRRALVDHARAKRSQKRGGDARHLPLEGLVVAFEDRGPDLVALEDALAVLGRIDPRLERVVELRTFGGATIEETAEALAVGHGTVERLWKSAAVLLARIFEHDA